MQHAKSVPLVEGIFTPAAPGEPTRIIASRCEACGATFFPPREICAACSGRSMGSVEVGPEGRLHTYTIQRDGGRIPDFKPYAVGLVDLGPIRVQGPLDVESFDQIAIDMRVEAYVRPVGQLEDGTQQLSYAFRPKRQ